jgi:hypothetical protein
MRLIGCTIGPQIDPITLIDHIDLQIPE